MAAATWCCWRSTPFFHKEDANLQYAQARSITAEAISATSTLPEYENAEISSLQAVDPVISRVLYWMKNDTKPTAKDLKAENKCVRKLIRQQEKLKARHVYRAKLKLRHGKELACKDKPRRINPC